MNNFLNRFRIPTLLGMGIIISAIAAGVYLTLREQTIISQAAAKISIQNITVTNLSDDSVTIFWQTSQPSSSFVTLGLQNPIETVALDDRDADPPTEARKRLLHYVSLKNLLPKTAYVYKIVAGKSSSDTLSLSTAAPLNFQTGLGPIIGSVLDGDKPLDEGIAILSADGATAQSALIKDNGNFLIPITQIRKADLSEGYSLSENDIIKINILSSKGQAGIEFKLSDFDKQLPSVKLGGYLNLTSLKQDLTKYDLNNDGGINSADYAVVFQNLGPVLEINPARKQVGKNPKADINGDGTVDQKDLDLITEQINQ